MLMVTRLLLGASLAKKELINPSIENSVKELAQTAAIKAIFASFNASKDKPVDKGNPFVPTEAVAKADDKAIESVTERVTAALTYRGSWNDYVDGERRDWNHIAAFGLTYDVADWLRLGANVSYSHNDSNTGFADYDNFVTGCSVSLRMAF